MIDIGIIIALKEEFREFKSEFVDLQHEKDLDTGIHYYIFKWPSNSDGYDCVATFIGDMGPEAAALATQEFIKNGNHL